MAIIEYTPWTEDKEEAKKQLAEYVQNHPKEGFMFDSNTPRPDTTYLLNGDEPVAEIFTVFIQEAAADNENIGEGFSYRDVLNNTLEHNPEFSKLKEGDETVSIIEKIKDYTDNHKKRVWLGSIIIIFCVVFGFGSMLMNKIFGNSNNTGIIIKSEHRFYASQGYMVGKFIAKNIPNAKVLLIENEDFKKSKYEQALIAALKKGMGNNNVNVVALKILNSDSEMSPSPVTSRDFDGIIGANSSTNVIVSVIGLPSDSDKMKLWKIPKAKRPELILINSNINNLIKLGPAVKKGMVSAVVIINPKAKLVVEASPPKLEDAFKKRYILVDKNNLAENEKLLP